MVLASVVEAAQRRAAEVVASGATAPRFDPAALQHVVAMGDPQAPSARFFSVLAHGGLLTDVGWLKESVRLIMVGDYFDFGGTQDRPVAARDGLENLAWLAAHAPEQVTLLAGNHDLARVGELVSYSDERFRVAHEDALRCYDAAVLSSKAEVEFLARYPELPSVEVAARDFSAFTVGQRVLVTQLLRSGRLQLATECAGLLFCHAGIIRADLTALGLAAERQVEAPAVAATLNRALQHALDLWDGMTPLRIPALHEPGHSTWGEGGGVLFHRPANPAVSQQGFAGPRRRRFDPRDLPALTQVIGHVRDAKCRQMLGAWATDDAPPEEGRIRSLISDGTRVSYRVGTDHEQADPGEGAALGNRVSRVLFLDNGLNYAAPEKYQILDVLTCRPWLPVSSS